MAKIIVLIALLCGNLACAQSPDSSQPHWSLNLHAGVTNARTEMVGLLLAYQQNRHQIGIGIQTPFPPHTTTPTFSPTQPVYKDYPLGPHIRYTYQLSPSFPRFQSFLWAQTLAFRTDIRQNPEFFPDPQLLAHLLSIEATLGYGAKFALSPHCFLTGHAGAGAEFLKYIPVNSPPSPRNSGIGFTVLFGTEVAW